MTAPGRDAALFGKLWRDARWLLLGCCLTTAAFAGVRVWLVAQLDTSRFRQILELLPGDFREWSPVDFDWIVGYTGRLSFIFQEPLVNFCLFVWCIARGSDAISGELDRGTGEMLLAQPISRRRYLMLHVVLTLIGIVAIAGSVWGGQAIGVQVISAKQTEMPSLRLPGSIGIPIPFLTPVEKFVPMRELVDPLKLVPATLVFASLGVMLAGVTTFVSSWDRYRWRTIGIATGFYVIQALIKLLATVVPSLKFLSWLTIFSAFEPEKIVAVADLAPEATWHFLLGPEAAAAGAAASGLGTSGAIAVLIGIGALGYFAAFAIFERRDLPSPL